MVAGINYRWTVRPRPTYSQGLAWSPLTFAVELESSGQSVLIVTVDASRPDNWIGSDSMSITPALVDRAIREALHQGWCPAEKGKAYELSLLVRSSKK